MNILYVVGALLLLLVLGYPYFLLVAADRVAGPTRIAGQAIAGLFVLALLLLFFLYRTGIAQLPEFSFMPDRPSTRITRGMSAYVTGMMIDDEGAIDEFIENLKRDPDLYQKFLGRLK